MKISDTHAFVNQLFVGLLVTIGCGGTAGLGLVWMRHQISVVADANAALMRQTDEVERHIKSVTALVEEELSSEVLRARNESMHLGLVEWTPAQVIAVNDDPMRGLVARATRRLYESNPEVASARPRIRLPLAQPTATPAEAPASADAATIHFASPTAKTSLAQPTRFQLAGSP